MPSEKSDYVGQKPHIVWIDLLRSFAICSVILVHVLDKTQAMNLNYMSRADLHTQICAFILFTIGRLGVPVFLFITGYLLLDRDYNRETCVRFWKRNWLGLLVTTEIWIVIYDLFLAWYNGIGFSGITLMKNMLFVQTVDMSHIWYMEMILGMYIFIPFVAIVLQKFEWKTFRLPMLLVLCFSYIVPTIVVVLNAYQKAEINGLLDLSFGGGVYGFMIVLGYFSKKGVFKKISAKCLCLTGVVCFTLTVMLQLFSYHHDSRWNARYNCVFVLITAFCIFEIISRKKKIPFPNLCRSLAKCSFGIYLVHFPLLMLIKKFWKVELVSPSLVIAFFLTLIISWIIVLLLGKIPKLGKILFFVK